MNGRNFLNAFFIFIIFIVFVFISIILYQRFNQIEITFFIFSFASLCLLIIFYFFVILFLQFKKDNISKDAFRDITNVYIKQIDLELGQRNNDYYDFQKLYYKVFLEMGKLKSKNGYLLEEIKDLKNKLTKPIDDSEKRNVNESLKVKEQELKINLKDYCELQHNLNGILDLLKEIKKIKSR